MPAMFARILNNWNGEAERITNTPQTENASRIPSWIARMPIVHSRARLLDIQTASVIVRTRMSVLPELGLEENPEAVEEGQEPEAGPDFAQVLGLIGAGREALQVGAVRDDRGREIDVQVHAEEAEQSPHPELIGAHVSHPLAPALEVLRRGRKHGADV